MNGAMRPTEGLPSQTERGAGVDMVNRRTLADAVNAFRGNEKAKAAARQISRSRQQDAAKRAAAEQRARQQALLEYMYADSVLGVPLEAIQQAVDQNLPWTPQPMAQPADNLAALQPPGMPLQGSMGV